MTDYVPLTLYSWWMVNNPILITFRLLYTPDWEVTDSWLRSDYTFHSCWVGSTLPVMFLLLFTHVWSVTYGWLLSNYSHLWLVGNPRLITFTITLHSWLGGKRQLKFYVPVILSTHDWSETNCWSRSDYSPLWLVGNPRLITFRLLSTMIGE